MTLRIRQIVFTARDLASAEAHVERRLGLAPLYRDPEVAHFGLQNAIMSIGDQFIEIISPIRADTAAGRHLDRHGDSAYMLILQTDDLARERARLARLGVRIVWESNYPDIQAIHLHPKDIGGAIVSLDEATPPGSWRWAGPKWQQVSRPGGAIVSATLAAREPESLAHRWAEVLGLDEPRHSEGGWRVDIESGSLSFVASRDGAERIIEFGVRGFARPLPVDVCGTRIVSMRTSTDSTR
jgi:hypothetical protein